MLTILQQIPLELFCLSPRRPVRNPVPRQQLLARMGKHESIGCGRFSVNLSLRLPGILPIIEPFPCTTSSKVRDCPKNKVLADAIDHTERQLTVVMGTEDRIELHIIRKSFIQPMFHL